MNKYKIWSFYGLATKSILAKKPYLTTYQGEGPQYEKIQNTVGQRPEISILCGCNRFFLEIGGGRWGGVAQSMYFDVLRGGPVIMY